MSIFKLFNINKKTTKNLDMYRKVFKIINLLYDKSS